MPSYSIESVYGQAFNCLFSQLRDKNEWWNTTIHSVSARQNPEAYWAAYDKEFERVFNETRLILTGIFNYDFGDIFHGRRRIELKHPRFLQELTFIEIPAQLAGSDCPLSTLEIGNRELTVIVYLLDRHRRGNMLRTVVRKAMDSTRLHRAKQNADFYNPGDQVCEWLMSEMIRRWELYRAKYATPDAAEHDLFRFHNKLHQLSDFHQELVDAHSFAGILSECEGTQYYLPNLKEREYANHGARDLTQIHGEILQLVLYRMESQSTEAMDINRFKGIYFDVMNDWLGQDYVIEKESLDEIATMIWPKLRNALSTTTGC